MSSGIRRDAHILLDAIQHPAGDLDLPALPGSGGPAYWEDFPKAKASGWTDPDFFPIAVYFGKPSHAAVLKAAGINVFMGAEHTESDLSSVTSLGISVLAQSNEWTPAEVGDDALVVGWNLGDEIEMDGSFGTDADRIAALAGFASTQRALDDGRFMFTNFGNGVLNTFWAPGTMDQYLASVDLSSSDKYAYTSPAVDFEYNRAPDWTDGNPGGDPARAVAYGWQNDQMQSFLTPVGSKPNWVFIETAKPYLTEDGATSITADQFEGAVWNSLIHGANGIALFQHNNDGRGNYSIVDVPEVNTFVTAVLAEVTALATVLNSPSLVWSFGTGLQTALKVVGNSAYILAMTDGTSGSRTFTLPAGLAGSVEVVGESRTLSASAGSFSDTFAAEYTHHIYQLGA